MIKNTIFAVLILLTASSIAYATPFVVSDQTTQVVTHCGVALDSTPKYDTPIVTGACKIDISGVSAGTHTIKATFVNIDPVWGRSESVFSAPLTFVKPASVIGIAPANLVISP